MTSNRRPALRATELQDLDDTALRAEALHYRQSIADIEEIIASARHRGDDVFFETRRALQHYRDALGFIKEINACRGAERIAEATIVGELIRSVAMILDDDDEAAWERLQAAYDALPAASRVKAAS